MKTADGLASTLHIRLGVPYAVTPDEWACPVALDGLHDGLHDAHGVDGWQALQLAQRLQLQLLTYFVEEGGCLCWSDDSAPVGLDELFPMTSLTHPARGTG